MNKYIVPATAIAAGVAVIFYLVKRNRKTSEMIQALPTRQSRHLTNAFTKAKQNVLSNHMKRNEI